MTPLNSRSKHPQSGTSNKNHTSRVTANFVFTFRYQNFRYGTTATGAAQ